LVSSVAASAACYRRNKGCKDIEGNFTMVNPKKVYGIIALTQGADDELMYHNS
jgi:hypothetical protein